MATASRTKPGRLKLILSVAIGLLMGLLVGRLYSLYTPIPAPVPVRNTQLKYDVNAGKGTVSAVVVRGSLGESFGYLLQAIQSKCPNPPVALTSVSPSADGTQALRPGTTVSINFECR